MRFTSQNSNQIQTMFGGGYVAEQHNDETHHNLPAPERREFVEDFAELLKTLRTALSLRSH
jgi:hypothetical protein